MVFLDEETPRDAWQRVKRIAGDAWSRPAADRESYVAEASRGDERLRAEVLTLLRCMDQAGEQLETPAIASNDGRRAAWVALGTPQDTDS